MKPVILQLAKYTAIFMMLVFIGTFVWANWNPPSPGEKAPVVNFIPYDISAIHDSLQLVKIEHTIEQLDGVRGATFNLSSGLLSIAYGIDVIEQANIEATVKKVHHIQLKEKQFNHTGPRCPVGGSLSTIARIKHLLCVRN